MNAQQLKHLESVPPLYRDMVARIYGGSKSRALAIKAHCLQCGGFVREEVRECRVTLCALHSFRPYQNSGEQEGQESPLDTQEGPKDDS